MAEKRARVARVGELAPGVRLVTCEAVDPPELDWKAGQFVSVRCGEGGDLRRSYTLVSSPADRRRFDLLVKDVEGGVGTGFFASLAVGAELSFTGPMGFFVADASHAGDVVHVVTGVGIAASLPIVEETLARAEPGRVTLLWGVPEAHPVYWRDRLDALVSPRFAWELVVAPDWLAVHARLSERATALLPGLTAPVFYTVGNGDCIRRVRDALVALGVDRRKQIRNEIFYPVMEGQK
jgi:ferredoxin-NADP reductase